MKSMLEEYARCYLNQGEAVYIESVMRQNN
jgi:hypothetical protein